MTFQEAQTTFQEIIRRIGPGTTAAGLLQAQRDLDALEDALRGKSGFDSIRAGIDDVYDKLVGTITQKVVADLQSRDEIFKRASASLASISQQAGQNAKTLALEKTRMVLPALNQSVKEVKGIVEAIKTGKADEALNRGQALLALVEQVSARLSEA